MGLGGISIWQLLIILAIVVMIFGTKRLKNLGSDLGGAVKGFRDSMNDEDKKLEEQAKDNTEASVETSTESDAATASKKD